MNFYLNLEVADDEPIPLSSENWRRTLKNSYNFYKHIDMDNVDDSGMDLIDFEQETKGNRDQNRPESSQVSN